MTDLSPETVERMVALGARKGGRGPHMDKTEATLSQLAQWADDAAANIINGWKSVQHFSGHMGGWEQSLLRHIASELRLIAAVLPKPVDPDLLEARAIMETKYYINDPEWQGDLDTTRAFKLIKRGRTLSTTASDQGRG